MAKNKSIGTGIALDGEKEFRNAIRNINKDMTVLGSEMKKVTEEFKDNKDSVEALTAKGEVLGKKAQEQADKVDVLKEALKQSAEQYGENDNKTKEWQIQLNNAEADLIKLSKEVDNNKTALEQAKNPTEDLGKEIKQVGDHADDAGQKSLKMGDIIKANLISEAIIGGVKALGAAFVSVAGGVKDALDGTLEYAGQISDTAKKTGMNTEELQKYQYAAKMSGLETEALEGAMKKSQKSFTDAASGSKELTKTYKELGIDVKKLSGPGEAFDATIMALADMEDKTKRNRIANDIFGKSYADLAPLLDEGGAGIDDLKAKAVELGLVMNEDAVNSGEALGDTLDTIKEQGKGLANSFVSILLPGLSDLATSGSDYMAEFSQAIAGADGDIGEIGEVIGKTLSDLVTKIVEKLPDIIEGAKSVIGAFMDGIMANMPAIIQTGTGIVMDLIQGLIQALPQIIQSGLDVIVSLANGIADSLPELVPTVVDTVISIVDTLIDNVDMLIDAAIEIILALADGLIEALPRLIEKAPVIVQKLVDAVIRNGPKLLTAAGELVGKLAIGIINSLPDLITSGKQMVNSVRDGVIEFVGKMKTAGGDLLAGLWQGLKDKKDWLIEKVKGIGSAILSTVKSIFGIHSPSSVFRDQVGKNLALGLGEGFEDAMKGVSGDMSDAIPTSFDTSLNVGKKGKLGAMLSAINITGNNFIINNDLDIDYVAKELAYRTQRELGGAGLAYSS